MTLEELAVEYRESARRIGERISQLKDELERAEDSRETSQLKERIKVLTTLRREASDIAVLCERYYERGYRRNARYTL